ncbi:uncharacterized protein LOC128552725 [Mercenaria mercenaria]|uniref:uncharacterized protein LOC128552725 n=1 Tax=Mercenaria mercenaria TaxID=6596 RepID=UPI00234ECCA5|nr:uncharacterized protein LOC128552725 [Mercenaria mercenaria]
MILQVYITTLYRFMKSEKSKGKAGPLKKAQKPAKVIEKKKHKKTKNKPVTDEDGGSDDSSEEINVIEVDVKKKKKEIEAEMKKNKEAVMASSQQVAASLFSQKTVVTANVDSINAYSFEQQSACPTTSSAFPQNTSTSSSTETLSPSLSHSATKESHKMAAELSGYEAPKPSASPKPSSSEIPFPHITTPLSSSTTQETITSSASPQPLYSHSIYRPYWNQPYTSAFSRTSDYTEDNQCPDRGGVLGNNQSAGQLLDISSNCSLNESEFMTRSINVIDGEVDMARSSTPRSPSPVETSLATTSDLSGMPNSSPTGSKVAPTIGCFDCDLKDQIIKDLRAEIYQLKQTLNESAKVPNTAQQRKRKYQPKTRPDVQMADYVCIIKFVFYYVT